MHPQRLQAILPILPDISDRELEYEDNFRELRGWKEEYQRTRMKKTFVPEITLFFLFPWMILRAVRLQHAASRFRRWHVS